MLTQRAPNWGPFAFAVSFEGRSGVEDLAGFRVEGEFWGGLGGGLRVGRRGRGAAAGLGLLEAEAVAVELKDVDVVGQAVEERAGQPLGSEDRRPFVKGKIRGNEGRGTLVAL